MRPVVATAAVLSSILTPVAWAEDDAAPTTTRQVGGSIAAVVQGTNSAGTPDGASRSRATYRGDLTADVTTVAGVVALEGFGHLRFGQGRGLSLRPTYTSTANSLAFEIEPGRDHSYAILAEAWAQAEWRLSDADDASRIQVTAGRMDFFGFFDQNAVAQDESRQFLDNAFVHNPLLDSGHDTGADAYGFAPGARLAWTQGGPGWSWGASIGAFGAGDGAAFRGTLGKPLVMMQVDLAHRPTPQDEPDATYRLYAWTNGQTTDLDGAQQRHTGFGASLDQRLGADARAFLRAGRRQAGDGLFDRTLTIGIEHTGQPWSRPDDAIAVALGWLGTGARWAGATADGSVAGYAAHGAERIAETYYRAHLSDRLELSADLQWIQRPSGDGSASTVRAAGLRARVGF